MKRERLLPPHNNGLISLLSSKLMLYDIAMIMTYYFDRYRPAIADQYH